MNREMLELYSDYLLSSFSHTTATGLSALTEGAVSHDQVTRFLGSGDFNAKTLWQLVKPLVREIESNRGVLIIDDTIEEKPYTDESELVCWHFDHSQGKSVKGINIVNLLYEVEGVRVPVGYGTVDKTLRVWDEKRGKWQRRSSVSKNEQAREMLRACVRNTLKFCYVLADSWYASSETMKVLHEELEKNFIMPVKSNRKVALSLNNKQHDEYQTVSSLALEANTVTQVYVEQLAFPMLLVKQVFRNEDGSEGVLYLVTDDLTLDYAAITTLYQKRWGVETFHKSLKSNASLAQSPAKTLRTQKNHIFCAIYAFVKLEKLCVRSKINHFALRSKVYLKALQASFQELRCLQLKAAA